MSILTHRWHHRKESREQGEGQLWGTIFFVSAQSTLSVHIWIMYSYSVTPLVLGQLVQAWRSWRSSTCPPLTSSGVKIYHTQIFYTSLPAITSSTTQITLETGKVALWNLPRQLNDVNTRSQHFYVLDPFPTSTSRHQYCLLLPLNAWQLNGHRGKVWFSFSLFLICLLQQKKNKQIQCTRGGGGGGRHATIASTNSTVKQRHLSRMLKALRAEASVTSIASGCQRWLKTWEQASVLKILCVGVCVRTSRSSKSDIWGALYRSRRLLGIFCIT